MYEPLERRGPQLKNKSLVALVGSWEDRADAVFSLLQAGFEITLAGHIPEDERNRPALLLALLDTDTPIGTAAEVAASQGIPWIAWNANGRNETGEAYRAGAIAVLGEDLSGSDLGHVARNTLLRLARPLDDQPPPLKRSYKEGERIDVPANHVLRIHEGVVSLYAVHPDGAEVLLGLLAPGQVLAGHLMDSCHVEVRAHVPVVASHQSWEQVVETRETMEAIRSQLLHLQGWASMQAHPYLEQRILGVLFLLAEQFGIPDKEGVLIGVRLTHSQIAAAVGATRTTVTRLIGDQERKGQLRVVGRGANARLWIKGPATAHRAPHPLDRSNPYSSQHHISREGKWQ